MAENRIDSINEKILAKLSHELDKLSGHQTMLKLLRPKVAGLLFLRSGMMLFKLLIGRYNRKIFDFIRTKHSISYYKDIMLFTTAYTLPEIPLFPRLSVRRMLRSELVLPGSAHPDVSIIIPVFNKIHYTFNCLRSLAEKLSDTYKVEIIVVNDCSDDGTLKVLTGIRNLVLINNSENIGFLRSCNRGVSKAKGRYICFLNNDTQVLEGWLDELVKTLENDEKAGLAGSMLIYEKGKLQEAGGIIFNSADGWNYGRLEDRRSPEYNYRREADYCSGASIMIRSDDLRKLGGGFDERYVPAYYEDTDLCFAVRETLGKKVIYQPKSRLVHYEGISSGTSLESGVKRFQLVNKEKFYDKWKQALAKQYGNSAGNVDAAVRHLKNKKTIIVIDSYVTYYDQESGSNRLLHLIRIFKNMGLHIIFVPDNGLPDEPYASMLQEMGIELLYIYENKADELMEQIKKRLHFIDYAWICRPEWNEKYQPVFKSRPGIKIIYDTLDLHFLRIRREWELKSGNESLEAAWKAYMEKEIRLAKSADITIAISEQEKTILTELGIPNVHVISNIHVLQHFDNFPGFEQREGLLFIGGYNHNPNVDAVTWLCREIMPLVWEKHPDVKVTLLGSNPSAEVLSLANDKITVTGFIKDVSSYFESSRIFLAPLRYGAGVKGKIGQSLEYGLPVISTDIGVEGMHLVDQKDVLVANDAETFAAHILQLYGDRSLWERLSENSQHALDIFSYNFTMKKLEKILGITVSVE